MALDPAWSPLGIRTLDAATRAKLKTAINSPVATRINWINSTYGATNNLIPSFAPEDEDALKPPAMVAFALAIARRTGLHDPALTGKNDGLVKNAVVRLVWSIANSHAANGGTWGGVPVPAGGELTASMATNHQEWQGALWVWLTTVAAELVWSDLTSTQQSMVTAMAQLEANRFLVYRVPYQRNFAGVMLTPGNTRAEENTWQASILLFCAGKFPTHPNATAWMSQAIELTLAAGATYLFPSSRRVYNGFSGWSLRGGSNIDYSGTLTNHTSFDPHPNYMASVVNQSWTAQLMFAWLRGRLPAASQQWGFRRLYRAFIDVNFPYVAGGSYLPPGGRIYDKAGGTYAIYWPQGDDGNGDNMAMFATMDVLAHVTGCDDLASQSALGWAGVHMQRQVDLARTSYFDFWNMGMAALGDWIASTTPTMTLSNAGPTGLLS